MHDFRAAVGTVRGAQTRRVTGVSVTEGNKGNKLNKARQGVVKEVVRCGMCFQ